MRKTRPKRSRFACAAGFTLLELMVAITVLAVLLGVGVPAFTQVIRNNQIAAQTNEFVTALTVTRSEALKRGLPVSICAANTSQDGCEDDAEDWSQGWLVFTDPTNPGTLDSGEDIIQVWPATSHGLNLVLDGGGSFIRYLPNGASDVAGTLTFDLSKPGCTGDNARQIEISQTGRIGSKKIGCPDG